MWSLAKPCRVPKKLVPRTRKHVDEKVTAEQSKEMPLCAYMDTWPGLRELKTRLLQVFNCEA